MQDSSTARREASVTFRNLIRHLAEAIGRHYIPVRSRATDIHEFIGPDSIHHELVKNLVRAIYKANRCGHLDAPVHAAETFNALGNLRARLSQSGRADVDQINLIDDIGWTVRELLARGAGNASARNAGHNEPNAEPAQILPLRRARY